MVKTTKILHRFIINIYHQEHPRIHRSYQNHHLTLLQEVLHMLPIVVRHMLLEVQITTQILLIIHQEVLHMLPIVVHHMLLEHPIIHQEVLHTTQIVLHTTQIVLHIIQIVHLFQAQIVIVTGILYRLHHHHLIL